MSNTKRTYIIYDGRAMLQGTEEASVLASCSTMDEVNELKDFYGDGVVYSYATDGDTLTDEQFEKLLHQ